MAENNKSLHPDGAKDDFKKMMASLREISGHQRTMIHNQNVIINNQQVAASKLDGIESQLDDIWQHVDYMVSKVN